MIESFYVKTLMASQQFVIIFFSCELFAPKKTPQHIWCFKAFNMYAVRSQLTDLHHIFSRSNTIRCLAFSPARVLMLLLNSLAARSNRRRSLHLSGLVVLSKKEIHKLKNDRHGWNSHLSRRFLTVTPQRCVCQL